MRYKQFTPELLDELIRGDILREGGMIDCDPQRRRSNPLHPEKKIMPAPDFESLEEITGLSRTVLNRILRYQVAIKPWHNAIFNMMEINALQAKEIEEKNQLIDTLLNRT